MNREGSSRFDAKVWAGRLSKIASEKSHCTTKCGARVSQSVIPRGANAAVAVTVM
jgi:hypothetical protein